MSHCWNYHLWNGCHYFTKLWILLQCCRAPKTIVRIKDQMDIVLFFLGLMTSAFQFENSRKVLKSPLLFQSHLQVWVLKGREQDWLKELHRTIWDHASVLQFPPRNKHQPDLWARLQKTKAVGWSVKRAMSARAQRSAIFMHLPKRGWDIFWKSAVLVKWVIDHQQNHHNH